MSETHPKVTPTNVPPVTRAPITPDDVCWVMRTLDRSQLNPPRTNYLGATLAALSPMGFPTNFFVIDSAPDTRHWIMAELGQHLPATLRRSVTGPLGLVIQHASQRLTNNQNAARALRTGLATGKPWIVHLEDDLDVCDDFFGSVCRWLTDERGKGHRLVPLYTFHAPYKGVQRAQAAGETAWLYPVDAFYGNQCWAMTRGMALSALAYLEDRMTTWRTGQGFDLILKEWATSIGHDYFVASAPSFVQHVGEDSSLHLGRFHQNGSFPGREWKYVSRT